MTNFAYTYSDDGQTWVRIVESAVQWDEPIAGWERILDLVNGGMYLRNGSREYHEGDETWRGA